MAAGENLRLGAIVTLASELIDHSKAMTIRIAGHSTATINVPVYDPALYSEAQESLPITGYVSGHYYDPNFSGEGMFVEVDPRGLILLALYTYYPDGRPLWLVGAGPVCVDLNPGGGAPLAQEKAVCVLPPNITEVPLQVTRGGGFFGDFDSSQVVREDWGKLRLEWESCSRVKLTLTATHSNSSLPTKNVERYWTRISSVEGAGCSG